MNRRSVVVLNGDLATLKQLVKVIRGDSQLDLIAVARSYNQAQVKLERFEPDLFLIDLELPDGDCVELIKNIRERGYKSEIMVITEFGDEDHVILALKAGATGYLLKGCSSYYIRESITQILSGGVPISAPIARYLLTHFQNDKEPHLGLKRPKELTAREYDVLDYLAKGLTYQMIARVLEVSQHTVATHIKHIYRKLEVRSRSEAVYQATKFGLIKLGS